MKKGTTTSQSTEQVKPSTGGARVSGLFLPKKHFIATILFFVL